MTPTRRYYAAEETAAPPIAADERLRVVAFRTALARGEWVGDDPYTAHSGRGRYPVTAGEAEQIMAIIMRGAVGGRQSGREALRQIGVEE